MIFVTGATGFVGSHLLYSLLVKGEKVIALKRENSDLQRVRTVFSYYGPEAEQLLEQVEWINGDLLDIYSMEDAIKRSRVVYHCGAFVSFDVRHHDEIIQINNSGTANLVNLCLEHKIEKMCYVSSIAALGKPENNEPINEETYWKYHKSLSAYSIGKFGGEREVWRAAEEGLDVIIVNPTIILGPGAKEQSSLKLIDMVYKGLIFYTKGVNGYVDVRDVVNVMIQLMESKIKNEGFLLNAEHLSYEVFFKKIAKELNVKAPFIYVRPSVTAIAWRLAAIRSLFRRKPPSITRSTSKSAHKKSYYSNQKIGEFLNFEFKSIDQTIQDSCRFYLKLH